MSMPPRIICQRAFLLMYALVLCSCASDYTEAEKRLLNKGTIGGTLIGAGTGLMLGGAIGALSGNKSDITKYAIVGASVGGVAGFAKGRQMAMEKIRQMRQYNRELNEYVLELHRSDAAAKTKAKPAAAELKKKIATITKVIDTLPSKDEKSSAALGAGLRVSFSAELSELHVNKARLEKFYADHYMTPENTGDEKEGSRGGRGSLEEGASSGGGSEGTGGGRRSAEGNGI